MRNQIRGGWTIAVALALCACAPKGEALYARAANSLANGNPRAAEIDLKNLLKADPQNAKARALLADALISRGDRVSAEIELQKARDLGAGPEILIVPSCRIHVAKGEFDQALAECDPAKAPPGSAMAVHVARGGALLGLKRAQEAKAEFESALKTSPADLDAQVGLANAAYALQGHAAAVAVMESAPPATKEQARYWLVLGSMHLDSGDYANAERAFQTALAKPDPSGEGGDRLTALGGLADAQLRQGKIEAANETSKKLQGRAPSNPTVKQLRAQVLAAGGHYEEARSLLEEVLADQPKNYDARTLLGIVNLQEGNLGQAEMNLQNVVANRPDDLRAQRLLADVRARTQSPEEALKGIQSTLAAESADAGMLAMAGQMALSSGDRAGAIAYLDRAAQRPDIEHDAGAQIDVANGYLAAGELDKALALLQSMPAGGQSDLQREYMLMVSLLRKGEKDKAIAEAEALLKRSGSDPKARNLVAGMYFAIGDRTEGRRQLEEAVRLQPDDPLSLFNLARLDLAEGKTGSAESRFKAMLAKDPKSLPALLGLSAVATARKDAAQAEQWLVKARDANPRQLEPYVALARYYASTRNFPRATAVFDSADKAMPNNPAVASARAQLALASGDAPGAIAAYERALKLEPGSSDYTLGLARAHFVNNDSRGALEVLDGYLKADASDTAALGLACAISMQGGDLEKATGYLERLRRIAPDKAQTLQLDGDLAMAQKRYRDAVRSYERSLEVAPNRAVVFGDFNARRLAGDANPEQPLADWLARNPGDFAVRALLAEQHRERGRLDAAAKLYEDGLRLAPDNGVLLNNLAVVYQAKKDPKALETAERAYKAVPQSAAIQDTYGWLLVQQGDKAKGLDLLASADRQAPNNPEIQYHLAAAMAANGDKDGALPVLKKALAGQLPPTTKAEAQALLEQLSK